MADEKTRILEMVAEGRITPEQAAQLLDALSSREGATPAGRWETGSASSATIHPTKLSVKQLMEASMHGVNAAFIQEMQEVGYDDLPLQQLVNFKMFGVNADYVRSLDAELLAEISPDELCELRMHGVTGDYIREMRELGYSDLGAAELTRRREKPGEEPELVGEDTLQERDR